MRVTPICLGTMTFGEQVSEADSHAILDRSSRAWRELLGYVRDVFSAQPRLKPLVRLRRFWETGLPSTQVFDKNSCLQPRWPAHPEVWRGYAKAVGMTAQDILNSCDASLKRLKTDVIDLYQIHWPERHVPAFGIVYFDPAKDNSATSIHEQLEALSKLVKAGKVRHIGLSNETPYGVHEFIRLADQHGLPRVHTIQNPYCLVNRTFENALDETCHRLNVSLLAYSPLAFGLLTGKYDAGGVAGPNAPQGKDGGRLSIYESVQKQRWGRPEALAAARRYNALARENGMTPTEMALAFCYTKWQVASTIIGVTSVAQLDTDLDVWGKTLSPEVLAAIDAIRWDMRDPAL